MDAQKSCDAVNRTQSHAADCAEILAEKYQRGLISRRDLLAALGALGLAPTALGSGTARAAVPDVVMANSGGDSSKWLAATFGAHYEKVTGGRMIMDGSGPSNGKVRAMVEANHVIWDLCDLGPQTLELGPSGLLSAIDYTIVDKSKVIPEFAYEYGVCNYLFAHVLAWDSAVISGTPTLADFFDLKKYPGKRSIRKDPEPMLELALQADGVPADKLYPLDVDRALKKIASIKDQVIFWETGSQSQTLLRDGRHGLPCAHASHAHEQGHQRPHQMDVPRRRADPEPLDRARQKPRGKTGHGGDRHVAGRRDADRAPARARQRSREPAGERPGAGGSARGQSRDARELRRAREDECGVVDAQLREYDEGVPGHDHGLKPPR